MILLTYVVGVCLTDIFLRNEMSIVTVELRLFTRVFYLTRLHNYCKKYLRNYKWIHFFDNEPKSSVDYKVKIFRVARAQVSCVNPQFFEHRQ